MKLVSHISDDGFNISILSIHSDSEIGLAVGNSQPAFIKE
jgi:hypothetical protein